MKELARLEEEMIEKKKLLETKEKEIEQKLLEISQKEVNIQNEKEMESNQEIQISESSKVQSIDFIFT